jgi:hypothetical protein
VQASLIKLFCALSVKVDEGVDEVGNTCTDVEEVDQLVIEIEVERVWHW